MVEILCHSCPKTKLRNTRIIPKILTKFKHVFLTMFASKSDSARISVENFISKYHPNFAAEYRKKCGPHSTRFQCRRHYVADIFCQKMSPKMSPTFKKCRRHLHRHFRRNYQNIGWVHRCLQVPAALLRVSDLVNSGKMLQTEVAVRSSRSRASARAIAGDSSKQFIYEFKAGARQHVVLKCRALELPS